jgi:hypothetical protein
LRSVYHKTSDRINLDFMDLAAVYQRHGRSYCQIYLAFYFFY